MRVPIFWILCAGLAAFGCDAEPPASEDIPNEDFESDRRPTTPSTPSNPPTTTVPTPKVEFSLDPYASTSPWNVVKLTGSAPADGVLLYETEGGGTRAVDVPSSGQFCVIVDIAEDATTAITLEARDIDGNKSSPLEIEVTQEGDPPMSPGIPVPKPQLTNLARGMTPQVHDTAEPHAGSWRNTTDGNENTEVRAYSKTVWTNKTPPQLVIPLQRRAQIERIVLKAPEGCKAPFGWAFLRDGAPGLIVNDGTGLRGSLGRPQTSGRTNTWNVAGLPVATHFQFWSQNASCSSWWVVHAFTEIEVWGYAIPDQKPVPPRPLPPPSC